MNEIRFVCYLPGRERGSEKTTGDTTLEKRFCGWRVL